MSCFLTIQLKEFDPGPANIMQILLGAVLELHPHDDS